MVRKAFGGERVESICSDEWIGERGRAVESG